MDAQTYIDMNSAAKLEYRDGATIEQLNATANAIRAIARKIDMKTVETYLENKRQYSKLIAMVEGLTAAVYSK